MKSNTLRGDEQFQKNVIRSLREYVDAVIRGRAEAAKGKRRQTEPRVQHQSQLSSGSETNLGESGGAEQQQQQMTGPRPVRQLSSAAETTTTTTTTTMPPVGVAEAGGGEAFERIEGGVAPSVENSGAAGKGLHPHPSKTSEGEAAATSSPPTHHATRTQSESSAPPTSSTLAGPAPSAPQAAAGVGGGGDGTPPNKSLTAPNLPSLASGSGGVAEGEGQGQPQQQTSTAASTAKQKPQNLGAKVASSQANPEPTRNVSVTGPEPKLDLQLSTEGSQLSEETSLSSQISTTTTTTTMELSTPSGIQGGGSLEANSTSSLSQDTAATEKSTSSDKTAGATGTLEKQNGKKKSSRPKLKQLKLEFQDLTNENVVKCTLNTSTGQVDFRFHYKYDKPSTIFKKFVSKSL